MNLTDDFSRRVVQRPSDAAWIASPLPGVDRRLLDRVGGEVARATSVVRFTGPEGALIYVKVGHLGAGFLMPGGASTSA